MADGDTQDPRAAELQAGLMVLQQGRYLDAEVSFRAGLREAEKYGDVKSTVTFLDELASALIYSGRYDQAEPLLRRELALAEEHLGPEGREVVRALCGLGTVRVLPAVVQKLIRVCRAGRGTGERPTGGLGGC